MAKKLSADQLQTYKTMQESAEDNIQKGLEDFAEEVKKSRKRYKSKKEIKEAIAEQKKIMNERKLCILKDTAELLKWKNGKDTDRRNKMWKLTNMMAIYESSDQSTINKIFFDAVSKLLLEDYDRPIEAFLSKKEARKVRKKKKLEEKYGESPAIKKAPKSDEEKKIASRMRRLKRKAKEENISLEEYMKKHGYGKDGKKIKKGE
jgi:hypothetical protein